MATVCPTNLTVAAICSALEEKTETTSVNFDYNINFVTMDIPKSFIGAKVSEIEFEDNEVLFAVIDDLGRTYLVGLNDITLKKGYKLIFSKIAD